MLHRDDSVFDALDRSVRRILTWIIPGLCAAILCGGSAYAENLATVRESIRVADLKRHSNVLASDTFEGREAGSRGGRAAAAYLVTELKKLGVEPAGADRQGFFQEFGREYRNLLAVLPGSDPKRKQEYILVCGHYDHVGYGAKGDSFGPLGQIHNGADDNASGTAAVLELAEAFSNLTPRPSRSILFAFWDGEEKGLLGSTWWARNPTVPLEQVRLVINADMIGRIRNDVLEIYGARTAPGLRPFVADANRDSNLLLTFNWDVEADSDHYPFICRGVPALMLHSGKHPDYHRPSDDVDKLNLDGMERAARLLFQLSWNAAQADEAFAFRSESRSENERTRQRFDTRLDPPPPRLGVTWDGDLAKQNIVRVKEVRPESPAEKAGLRRGDEIVEFAGRPVGGANNLRAQVVTAPVKVDVAVKRNGALEPLSLKVQLDGRPVRLGVSWREDDAEPGCVIITRVVSFSPAALAGVKRGDRLRKFDGLPVASSSEFRQLVKNAAGAARVRVERRGRLETLEIVMPR